LRGIVDQHDLVLQEAVTQHAIDGAAIGFRHAGRVGRQRIDGRKRSSANVEPIDDGWKDISRRAYQRPFVLGDHLWELQGVI
jgi:hypothetical protein